MVSKTAVPALLLVVLDWERGLANYIHLEKPAPHGNVEKVWIPSGRHVAFRRWKTLLLVTHDVERTLLPVTHDVERSLLLLSHDVERTFLPVTHGVERTLLPVTRGVERTLLPVTHDAQRTLLLLSHDVWRGWNGFKSAWGRTLGSGHMTSAVLHKGSGMHHNRVSLQVGQLKEVICVLWRLKTCALFCNGKVAFSEFLMSKE